MKMNYGSDAGCKSGSCPIKLQTCGSMKHKDGGRKSSDFRLRGS